MTDKQKARLKVKLFQKGYNVEQINETVKKIQKEEAIKKIQEISKLDYLFSDGEKSKLNYEKIISNPDYIKDNKSTEKQVIEYHKFIEDNKDKILTVELNDKYKTLVTFKEDERDEDIKWIFSPNILIPIGDNV